MSGRIAITVTGPGGLSTSMDPRFGRAHMFLVVEDGDVIAELQNPAADAGHGAGTGAAAMMGEQGIGTVISGAFGPKAHAALTELGIAMRIAPSGLTAAEALGSLEKGELESPAETRVYR